MKNLITRYLATPGFFQMWARVRAWREVVDVLVQFRVTLLVGLVIFLALVSNHAIIFNEEVLVALAFFSFIAFVTTYYSNDIQDSLDARAEGIKQEIEAGLALEAAYLGQCSLIHSEALKAVDVCTELGSFVQSKGSLLQDARQSQIHKLVETQVKTKLVDLDQSSTDFGDLLQEWRDGFRSRVKEKIRRSPKNLHRQWIRSCLAKIQKKKG